MSVILDWLSGGFLDLSVVGMVIFTLIVTHVTIVSVTVYLHRHAAHRSVEVHPALAHFFRFWLWLTTGMITREWAAIHRKHHAVCETEEDPHSPRFRGCAPLYGAAQRPIGKPASNVRSSTATARAVPMTGSSATSTSDSISWASR